MWNGARESIFPSLDGMIAKSMAKSLVDKYRYYSYKAILNDITELPYNCSRERFAAMIRYFVLENKNE